jgi:repressor LexA
VPSLPTPRQEEIAAFLRAEFERRGIMPTQREIQAEFGFSSQNAVRSHLRLMEQKGMLARHPGKARSLRLTITPAGIPLIGSIAAGSPVEAQEEIEGTIPIAAGWFSGSDLFALRISGDSMVDVGILPGDIAILNKQQRVENGEIAAVLFEGEATLKYFHQIREGVVLKGANSNFRDIVIPVAEAHGVSVLGKYVGLLRRKGGVV